MWGDLPPRKSQRAHYRHLTRRAHGGARRGRGLSGLRCCRGGGGSGARPLRRCAVRPGLLLTPLLPFLLGPPMEPRPGFALRPVGPCVTPSVPSREIRGRTRGWLVWLRRWMIVPPRRGSLLGGGGRAVPGPGPVPAIRMRAGALVVVPSVSLQMRHRRGITPVRPSLREPVPRPHSGELRSALPAQNAPASKGRKGARRAPRATSKCQRIEA